MRLQKGFTLIELMVVIVIIGILSALAVPKMFGTSAKAKAAEVPTIASNWETLQSTYIQEKGAAGAWDDIGFKDPSSSSKWFLYSNPTNDVLNANVNVAFGDCGSDIVFASTYDVTADTAGHSVTGTAAAACGAYVPNFLP
jgi:prepilin-type N-terminal cleavage/methylation domain-containing protein